MKVHLLEREQVLRIGLEEAWEFFSSPRNLDQITPDDLGFRIERCEDGPMYEGQIITYRVRLAPLVSVRWVTEIKSVDPGRAFVDEQRAGPYKIWHHRHSFEEVDGGVRMRDVVNYAIGFGPFGEIPHALFVRKKLHQIFGYREEILRKRFGAA